jgi:hypothetical protein
MGLFEVQDEGSQLVAGMVRAQPGERVRKSILTSLFVSLCFDKNAP